MASLRLPPKYSTDGTPQGKSTITYYPDGEERTISDYDASGKLQYKTSYITGLDGSKSKVVSEYGTDGKPMTISNYNADGTKFKYIILV